MQAALLLGLTLGLASALHCIAMCSPLVAFVALGPQGQADPWRVARYQAGRVVGYGALGAVLGAFGGTIADWVPSSSEALLSMLLGIALALAAFQLWPRAHRPGTPTKLGRGPRKPSLRERSSRAVASLLARVGRVPTLLGVLSALLPCGVIASGALLAASTGHAIDGAAAMVGLALSSGLAVVVTGLGLGRTKFASSPVVARTMAVALALGALVLFARPLLVTPEGGSCCHAQR